MENLSPFFPIYIFAGDEEEKVCQTNVEKLKLIFKKAYPHSPIYPLTSSEFYPSDWASNSLVVLPDGICSQWKWLHNPAQVQELKKLTELGASVFGIGAGAYACCKESQFKMENDNILKKARGLDFYPGQGIGPLISEKHLISGNQTTSPEPIELIWNSTHLQPDWRFTKTKGYTIINGGGYFLPSHPENEKPQYEVLATYKDRPSSESIAVVKCQTGKGTVVLSFPQLVYDAHDYPLQALEDSVKDPFLESSKKQIKLFKQNYNKIEEGEEFRSNCLGSILKIFERNAFIPLYTVLDLHLSSS